MFEMTDQSRIYVHRRANCAQIPMRSFTRKDASGRTKHQSSLKHQEGDIYR